MTSYLSELTADPAYKRLADLKPPELCPYLFYNLVPYIVTLAAGGWFNWVIRPADPTRRRPPLGPGQKLKKRINRHYPNEVLVGCPNPAAGVVVGVGPWTGNRICLRIIRNDRNCPCPHPPGRPLLLNRQEDLDRAVRFYRLFPEILLRSRAGISLEKAIHRFNRGHSALVSVAKVIHPCRYHQKPGPAGNLLPDNGCPHVFWHIYPRILARMYQAGPSRPLFLNHPGTNEPVTVTIEKTAAEKSFLRQVSRALFDHLGRFIRHPRDRLDYSLAIKVVQQSQPDCPLRQGQRYGVNLDNPDFLCPAAFGSLYPYLLLTGTGTTLPWNSAHSRNEVACPDCVGIVYELNPA
ncbi:MAG: hypothetical protein ACLFS7_09530 [Desulfosudaceae bacterium]